MLLGRYLQPRRSIVIKPQSYPHHLSPALQPATEEAGGNATSNVEGEEVDPGVEKNAEGDMVEGQKGNNGPSPDVGEGVEVSEADLEPVWNGADATVVDTMRDVDVRGKEEVFSETMDEPGEDIVEVNKEKLDRALVRAVEVKDGDPQALKGTLTTAVVRTKAAEGTEQNDQHGIKTVKINGREYLYVTEDFWMGKWSMLGTAPRPLAESRIFDFTWMVEEKGFIKRQEEYHQLQYSRDIKLKTDRIHPLIEKEVLHQYSRWAMQSRTTITTYPHDRSKSGKDEHRNHSFVKGLHEPLMQDLCENALELYDHESSARRREPHRWGKLLPQLRGKRERLMWKI